MDPVITLDNITLQLNRDACPFTVLFALLYLSVLVAVFEFKADLAQGEVVQRRAPKVFGMK